MKRVLLGLGSNKSYNGKTPLEILACAQSELSQYLANLLFSSVYKTKAMYVEDQDDFYNMVAVGFVPDDFSPFDLLEIIHQIEAKYGRNRDLEIRFGPRSLDIDIELFGDEIINTPELQIPHIRVEERAFVLIPTLEILNNTADELIREKYQACLNKLQLAGQTDGIEKLGGSQNGKSEEQLGNKSSNKA